MASALRSAALTKSLGPFRETCRFSTSPKSRLSERAAFITASVMTVIRGDRIMTSANPSSSGSSNEGAAARSGSRRTRIARGFASRPGLQQPSPLVGQALGAGALLGSELAQGRVEPRIGEALGRRREVPGYRLHQVLRHAAAG